MVATDKVGVVGAGFIGNQNSAGVVSDFISHDGDILRRHQVNAFAAVVTLVGLEGWNVVACRGGYIKGFVVVCYEVTGKR